jgi:flagellar biosynthesis protein FliP
VGDRVPTARVPLIQTPPALDLRDRIVAAMPRSASTPRRRWMRRALYITPVLMIVLALLAPAIASAQAGINLTLDGDQNGAGTALQLLVLLTVLTLAPSILIMMTSFTRIIVVLGFLRNALGTPTTPPTQVLVGIAVFLSLFVMAPTLGQINEQAVQPLMNGEITEAQAVQAAEGPIRDFMFEQVDQKDLSLFLDLTGAERPETRADVPTSVLIPAFVLSELQTAFEIGFLIFIPFLIIDMVIASTVMSMGMVMLPPVIISLPFKILLFVLVDGWHLVSESLVRGFFQ